MPAFLSRHIHLSRPYSPSPDLPYSPKTPADVDWVAALCCCCCCSGRSASPCARCLCRELSLSLLLLLLMLLADDAAAAAAVSGIMLLLFQRGNDAEMVRSVCGYTPAGLNEGEGEVKVVVSHPVCSGMRGETDCGVRSRLLWWRRRGGTKKRRYTPPLSVCLCFQILSETGYCHLLMRHALAGWPQHECVDVDYWFVLKPQHLECQNSIILLGWRLLKKLADLNGICAIYYHHILYIGLTSRLNCKRWF